MSGQRGFRAACLLLTVTLMGSATGTSEADAKVLEVLQKAVAGVKDWDSFKVESKYTDTQTYYQDFLLPIKRVVAEGNKVAIQKAKDGKYKTHTDIKRVDDYHVSMFTSLSKRSFWHYQWVRSEEGFWFKIESVPRDSAIARQRRSFIGKWTQGDEKLRGGYDNMFTDHVNAGLDSADFLKKEAVQSIKELNEETIKGKLASCYEILPVPEHGPSSADMDATLQSLATSVRELPEGFGVDVNKKLDNRVMATENAAVVRKHKVCVSKGDDKALLLLGSSLSEGPLSGRVGYHYLMHLFINKVATRTYYDVNEPVEFPVFKGPSALEVA